MEPQTPSFWSVPAADLLKSMGATPQGLSAAEARGRLTRFGANVLKPPKRSDVLTLFLSQFKSPIILILIGAAILSAKLGDKTDTIIIMSIVLVSGLLGFWQEHGAANAVKKLLAIVQTKAVVIRDGKQQEIPTDQVVPGDVVVLSAGGSIPGDCLLLEATDLFLDEATLTGETYPVEKSPGVLPAETALAQRTNTLFMATHVVSGSGQAVVIHTAKDTEFGAVSARLTLRPPETEFEHGVRRFGYLLMEVTLVMVVVIFAVNTLLHKDVLNSLLFSLAIAVGLTPQLLPAIISINLSHGARRMALEKVIVRRLSSIENFGSMNVLCSDKTGTLTDGTVRLKAAVDVAGTDSDRVLLYAYLNAFYETGFANPIDEAIRTYRKLDVSAYKRLDEVPYDFLRKRLTIVVSSDQGNLALTKGAVKDVLAVCTLVENPDGTTADIAGAAAAIQKCYEEFSGQGFRTLGIASRKLGAVADISKDDEKEMTFCGFLVLFDPPKPGIVETVGRLKSMGVSLKMITGDNRLVAAHMGGQVGLSNPRVLTGPDLRQMSDGALLQQVGQVDVYAEIEPNQKERLIIALKKAGNVVGYMGDGINDASALHAADVGISVNTAVDVAKEAADIVLLEQDLAVLAKGVQEGRTTFANTLKYVFMATSANFGNMFSMAGASLFLSFLPLLPKQILLTNLMTDFPEMTIATDNVDPEMVLMPRRWDIHFIRSFMMVFGLISSIFDYMTFGVLLLFLHAKQQTFQTGWFIESVVSASLIVLVVRTRRPFFKSKPGKPLLIATLIIAVLAVIFPYTPLGGYFGFVPLPPGFLVAMAVIVALYMITAEVAKSIFYRRFK